MHEIKPEIQKQLDALQQRVARTRSNIEKVADQIQQLQEQSSADKIKLYFYKGTEILQAWREELLRVAHQEMQTILAEGRPIQLPTDITTPHTGDCPSGNALAIKLNVEQWDTTQIAQRFYEKTGGLDALDLQQAWQDIAPFLRYGRQNHSGDKSTLRFHLPIFERQGHRTGTHYRDPLIRLESLVRMILHAQTRIPFSQCRVTKPVWWQNLEQGISVSRLSTPNYPVTHNVKIQFLAHGVAKVTMPTVTLLTLQEKMPPQP